MKHLPYGSRWTYIKDDRDETTAHIQTRCERDAIGMLVLRYVVERDYEEVET